MESLERRALLSGGELDPSFGSSGVVQTDFGGTYDTANAVLVYPDGRILVGGRDYSSAGPLGLARYLPDGSPDPTFGATTPGRVSSRFISEAYDLAVLGDGKILVAGGGPGTFAAVMRLYPDGALDTTFARGRGIAYIDTGFPTGHSDARAMAVLPDGRIALAGEVYDGGAGVGYHGFVARIRSDGTTDTTFGGGDGATLTSFDAQGQGWADALVALPDGRLVIGGHIDRPTGTGGTRQGLFLARYLADGSLDFGFGSGGLVAPAPPASAFFGEDIDDLLLLPDGRLLAAGGADSGPAVFQFTPDGQPDASFDGDGHVTLSLGGNNHFYGLARRPTDGKIYAAGFHTNTQLGADDFLLARFNANGSPDNAFSGDGMVISDLGTKSEIAYDVALSPGNNAVVVVGTMGTSNVNGNFATARYQDQAPGGAVAGAAYYDANANGTREAVEAALAGRTVWLDDDNDAVLDPGERSAVTGGDGAYRFDDVAPGQRYVRQVLPANWRQTAPGASGQAHAPVVVSNGLSQGLDFGATDAPFNTISGVVFNDLNQNFLLDAGEPRLAGRAVYDDADHDNVLDPDEARVASAADGSYALPLDVAGQRIIRQVLPAGWQQSWPVGGFGLQVSESGGAPFSGFDFGSFVPPPRGRIAGAIWDDTDRDGAYDAGEPRPASRVAWLDADDDGVLDAGERTAATAADGTYAFDALPAGNYVVRAALPAGMTFTAPAAGRYAVALAAD